MRSSARTPALAALACVAGLMVLLVVAYAVPPFPAGDAQALRGLEALQGPVASPICDAIAHSADPIPLGAMLIIVALAGLKLGRRRQVVAAVAAVAGANVVTQILKIVLAHPRFHPLLNGDQVAPAAFPSGHATAAMSIALAAVIVSPPRLRPTVASLSGLYVLGVTSSILIRGWHFPSDVLGGLLVAAAFAFGAVAVSRALAGRASAPTSLRSLSMPAGSPTAIWLAVAAGSSVVVLARAHELLAFARGHTTAIAALAGVTAACAALLASASLLADR